ncbi:MAG: malonic semialdehyde reductase [Gammaproteobacteria bacterium]
MKHALDDAALDTLFREARSYNRWAAEPVSDATLHSLYELLKFGPTATNSMPARFVFVTGAEAKAKLIACVSPGNVVKVEQAPVTAIIAMDERFYEKLGILFPQRPGAADSFKDSTYARTTMMRNATLQGAYLILAARALGLDCGPMSGFDNAKVDTAFFAGTTVKSNFICALGTGTTDHLFARLPRLPFDEACRIV